ncbi:hypothetical protein [Actinomadura sp. 7K507]|uniref:hypothetical protein n=1 Tax=Actinomadura sp. 7K507 TaxID=2530365 RepID=UPI00104FC86E|nr:hypothetical protein [Actinomadura sp. 7K507]TDC81676.1 hypothetical protein E1285_32195 [Actinomadura sp. 7K507]
MVFLHVGAAKSGTTYLQNLLWHNRDRLREHGVLYPGADQAAHVRAAFDLRRTFFPGASDPEIPNAWPRLIDEVRDWDGSTIISQELFAPSGRKYVRRAMADLDFAEVHVVFTTRDLARQIPAHWQEDIKNRFGTSFTGFMEHIKRPNWLDHEISRLFWTLQDPVYVLERWGMDLPPERVHIVTLPRPGAPRDLLWRRFCAAVRLSPDDYDLAAPFDNPSLGLAETQFLLRLNTALDRERLGWHFYNDEVKLFLAQRVLAGRPTVAKTVLPAEHLPWATERSGQMVEGLRAAGYNVVGDLDELIPAAGPATAPDPDEPRWADVADVGMEAITAVLQRLRDEVDHAAHVPGSETPVHDQVDAMRPEAGDLRELTSALVSESLPLTHRAVRKIGERYPAARRLRGAYRRLHRLGGSIDSDKNRR